MKPTAAIMVCTLAMAIGATQWLSTLSVRAFAVLRHRNFVAAKEVAMSQENVTRATLERFNEAFNRHDADALSVLLTEDTVFEDTSPAPDGGRLRGRTEVTAFWREWFARNSDARFETEEIIVSGDRAVVLWVYHKMRNGQPWHLRGVDVFTVRDGKVAAKLAYVKG